MALANLLIKISADIGGLERNVNLAIGRINRLSADLGSLGSKLTGAISLPLMGLGIASVKSAADLDGLRRGLTAVTGSAQLASVQFESLKEVAKLPGLGFKEALQGAINLQAAGFSAQQAERSLLVFGNALATVGRGKADLDGVIVQLQQMSGKSKVLAEDIKPLIQRVPQVATVMKQLWGVIDTEELQKKGVGAQEFIKKVTDELSKLPKVTGGIKNALENMSDSLERSLAEVGNNLVPFVEKFVGEVAEPILKKISEMAKGFKDLSPQVQNFSVGLASVAIAGPPAIWALGQFAIGATAAFKALKGLIGLLTLANLFNPITAVLTGIALLTVGVAHRWKDLKKEWEEDKFISAVRGHFKEMEQGLKNQNSRMLEGAKATGESGLALLGFRKHVENIIPPVGAAEKAVRALASAETALGVSRDDTSKAVAAYSYLTKAWEDGRIKADVLGKAYGELQKRLLETGQVAQAIVTPAWIALTQAQDKAKESGARILAAIAAFVNAGQSWGDKIKLVAIEHDNLGFSMKGSALEAADLAQTLQILTGKYPKVEQAAIDMGKAIKGSILETAAIMKSIGLKSTAEMRDETDRLYDAYLRLIELQKQGKATAKDVADAYEALTNAELKRVGASTTVAQQQKKALQEVSTIINDMSRDIARSIIHWKGFGDVVKSTLQSIGESILRNIIQKMIESSKIIDVVTGALGKILGKIPGLGGVFGGAASAGASGAASAAGSAASAAGGVASAAGSATSAAGSAATSALSGWIGAIGSAVSAVSGVIGNFQFMGMNKSLDIIVKHTLQAANDLANLRADSWLRETHLFNKLDDWRNYAQLQMDTLIGVTRGGGGPITLNNPVFKFDAAVQDPRAQAQAIIRELKALSPAFS